MRSTRGRLLLAGPNLREPNFFRSVVLIVFYSLLPIVIGLLLAALLSRIRIRGMGTYRVLLFLPQTIAMVVVAIAWVWIYSQNGPVNEFLRLIGLDGLTRAWLGDFDLALPAIGLVGTWLNSGLCMVLFIAGVQKIPQDLYDAARVDGAGAVREFFAVTLPGLRNELVVALTLTVIFALRNFDLIWVSTGGGPGDATTVPSVLLYELGFEARRLGTGSAIGVLLTGLIGTFQSFTLPWLLTRGGPNYATELYSVYLYRNAFVFFKMGYASAQAWVMFVIIVVFTVIMFRVSGRMVYYGGR